MFENYTKDARKAIFHTQEVARSLNHPAIDVYHILLGVLKVDAKAAVILRSNGLTYDATMRYVQNNHPALSTPSPTKIPYVLPARPVFNRAYTRAASLSHRVTDLEHIAMVVLSSGNQDISALMTLLQIDTEKIQRDLVESAQ